MNRTLLIIYEPALFLLAGLGWAGWELWSMRKKKDAGTRKSDRPQAHDPPTGSGE